MNHDLSAGSGVGGANTIREAVCVHTDKVYDSCRDKECLEDVRVYLSEAGQALVDRALSVKSTKAEVLWVYSDVEPVPFNQGYYTIDIKFFFKVTLDLTLGVCKNKRIEGLAIYDKKVVLFGSEGKSKIFQSNFQNDSPDEQQMAKSNLPKAIVEVVDPISLSAKIVDKCQCSCCDDYDILSTPQFICNYFEDAFIDPETDRRVYVTLGLFSIVKLERSVQLLIPVYDFCIPNNDCVGSTSDNPCELFDKINFPVDEFYPPSCRPAQDNCCCNTDSANNNCRR